VLSWSFVTCSKCASRDLCGAFSTFLEIETPPFAGDARADLLLVQMLILAGEVEVEVHSAAVTNKAWPPRNAFFVGWCIAGLLIKASRSP
jgi:hypothetical protein